MKYTRFILLIVGMLSIIECFGQAKSPSIHRPSKQELARDSLLIKIERHLDTNNRYKLYQTDNIYTLLQLDTKTGQILQVQWSLDVSQEGSAIINSVDLSTGGNGSNNFELYPTKNIYQFILMDKTDGRKWHVQWGMEYTKRWIRPIY